MMQSTLTQSKEILIRPIHTEEDYQFALDRLGQLLEAKQPSKEADELNILSLVIEDYENAHHPIGLPDPVEAIKVRMEDLGLKQKDLVGIIGGKSRVSEILNRKKGLTLGMVRELSKLLGLSIDLLVQQYELER